MSISPIRPVQGQSSVQSLTFRRVPDKNRPTDRNAGPDTVSISPEALALSKAKGAGATLLIDPAESMVGGAEATLRIDPADALPGGAGIDSPVRRLSGSPPESVAGDSGAVSGISGNSPDMPANGSSFLSILRRELIKAMGLEPRFAGP